MYVLTVTCIVFTLHKPLARLTWHTCTGIWTAHAHITGMCCTSRVKPNRHLHTHTWLLLMLTTGALPVDHMWVSSCLWPVPYIAQWIVFVKVASTVSLHGHYDNTRGLISPSLLYAPAVLQLLYREIFSWKLIFYYNCGSFHPQKFCYTQYMWLLVNHMSCNDSYIVSMTELILFGGYSL